MTEAEDILETFNAQWYNTIVNAINVGNKFQLAQGATSLGTTSSPIWNILDAIPPKSVDHFYDPAQHNSLSQVYGSVINNLKPQNEDDLTELLGDDYTSWQDYMKEKESLPNEPGEMSYEDILAYMFKNWSITVGLEPSKVKAGITLMEQADIVSVAIATWVVVTASTEEIYAYTATKRLLDNAIGGGEKKTAKFDSKTASADISHTWAGGSVSGAYRFFSGEVGGSWDKLTKEFRDKGINTTVEFASVATLVGSPLAKADSLDPDLKKYDPWWNSAALKVAKDNNDNNVWKHTAPHWEDIFGDNGSMQWLSTALLVADGIKTTMTSKASVAKSEQESVKAAFKAGYWPFFQAEGHGGWSHDVKFNDDGSFVVESSSKKGNPIVIGVLVDGIDEVLN